MKKTLVIGASVKPDRYANKAIRQLLAHQHEVAAISNRAGQVEDVVFHTDLPKFDDIDTVTLYLNPTRPKDYYDDSVSLKPRRVIFNPATENEEWQEILRKHHIQFEEACTFLLLATNEDCLDQHSFVYYSICS